MLDRIKRANKTAEDPNFWFNRMWKDFMNVMFKTIFAMFGLFIAMSAISQESIEIEPMNKTFGYVFLVIIFALFGCYLRDLILWIKNRNWNKWRVDHD